MQTIATFSQRIAMRTSQFIKSKIKLIKDGNDDQAADESPWIEDNIDGNDDQADDENPWNEDNTDGNDDQADDENDIDINEILWNIELNPENLVWPRLPNVIGQAEHIEINIDFGDLIQRIINNRVTIQVAKYATGG